MSKDQLKGKGIMPRGKGRRPPPPGYMSAAQAGTLLGENRLYKLVQKGKLQRHTPEGYSHVYYSEKEIQAILNAEKTFFEATQEVPMQITTDSSTSFVRATPADMDALYKMAVKLFPHTVGPERRKEWIRHEPRGHYIVKRADGSVVAYLYLLALKRNRSDLEPDQRDRMALYLRHELLNKQIIADDIHQLVPNQPVDIAIGGIASDPDLSTEQRTEYTARLLHGVRHDLENLGREGFIFSNAYAFSETRDGIALCVKLGMHEWEPPRHRFYTFQLDILHSRSILFKGYRRGLAEYQARKKGPNTEQ